MTRWYQELDDDSQKLVSQRWGSEEFANWTASFLLNVVGGTLMRKGMSKVDKDRFNYLMMQRRVRAAQPGHEPDLAERLYSALHSKVASVVGKIDNHTGRHGTEAVQWLDRELQELQSEMVSLYERMTG